MDEAELLQIESKDDIRHVYLHDLPRMAAEVRRCWQRIQHLEEALQSVDRQVPDAIGGEPYVISPGALYKVRTALYGSGGPRPKAEAALSREPSEAPPKELLGFEQVLMNFGACALRLRNEYRKQGSPYGGSDDMFFEWCTDQIEELELEASRKAPEKEEE